MSEQPKLPFELFEHIIRFVCADLKAYELRQPTPSRRAEVQQFLSSASLVSPTFRDIAQPLLLSHAFVHRGSVYKYIAALGRRASDSPPIRTISVGPENHERAEWDESAAVEVGETLSTLLQHLPDLEELECVTCIPSWEGGWLAAPNQIQHLSFIFQTVRTAPPLPPPTLIPQSLTFIESPARQENFQTTAHLKVLYGLFPSISHLSYTTKDFFILAMALERLRFAPQPHLRTLHLEAHETSNRGGFITANANSHEWTNLEVLEVLETHALFLPPPSCEIVLPPTLRRLKVLRDSHKAEWKLDRAWILEKVLRDVPELEEVEIAGSAREEGLDALRGSCEVSGVRLFTAL